MNDDLASSCPTAAYKEVDPAVLAKYAPERLETKKGKAKTAPK